jgi:hypothetical protein
MYTLTEEEAALFRRAWGPDYSWNPYNWYKVGIGQFYYRPNSVGWGTRMIALGKGTGITVVIGGVTYVLLD